MRPFHLATRALGDQAIQLLHSPFPTKYLLNRISCQVFCSFPHRDLAEDKFGVVGVGKAKRLDSDLSF